MAKALSRDLDISTKVAIEISNYLKGRSTENAKEILRNVLNKTQAIPFKRFTDGVGHRKGAKIGSGRYPKKGSEKFLMIIESAEANAQAKGLSSDLKIIHLCAQKGTNQFRSGRQRRRAFKRTHLEIVVEEMDKPKQKSASRAQKTDTKSAGPKQEVKKDAPKKEEKPTKEKSVQNAQDNKSEKAPKKEEVKEEDHESESKPKTDNSSPKAEAKPVKEEKKEAPKQNTENSKPKADKTEVKEK